MTSIPNQRRSIITGASSGIGEATALAFANAGIHTALVSRSMAKLEVVAEKAIQSGVEAKAYSLNLSNIDRIKENFQNIIAEFGPVDILVNSAGIGYTGNLQDTPLADWQKVIALNLTSVFECTMAVVPQMRERGKGMIINIASIAGQTPFPGWGAYSVSKAGLIAFSKVLAAEERANGIRVVTISPGAVNTPIWDTDTVDADFNRSAMLTPEIVAQSIVHTAMLPEQAVVDDITLMPSAGAL